MASIPLPALGIKPIEQPDMFGNLAKALSVKNLQQESQRSTIETQQAQQGQLDQQAFRAAMTDPSMKGKTIGEIADALAGSGHISQASWVAAKKADVDQRKTFAELTEKDLINRAKSHEMTFDLYKNVMAMPDEQLATAWPQIAQQYDSIPGNKPILDPMKPLTKQQLGEMGPMLDMHEAYLASELAKRKAANEAKTSGQKEVGGSLYDVSGDQPKMVIGQMVGADPTTAKLLNVEVGTQVPLEIATKAKQYLDAGVKSVQAGGRSLLVDSTGKTIKDLGASTPVVTMNMQMGGGGTANPSAPVDFYAKLSPSERSVVDSIGKGKTDLPTALSPYRRFPGKASDIQAAVNQKYPDWAQSDYGVTKKLEESFSSGDYSKNLNAIDTARQHMQLFKGLAAQLDNGDVQAWNKLGNALGVQFGSDKVTNFNIAKQFFSGEVGKAVVNGGGTGAERDQLAESINTASSTQQLAGAFATSDGLLEGKQKALKDTYESWKKNHKPNFGSEQKSAAPAGATHAVKDASGKIIGYTSDGKTMTPAQ